jgi:hypothetical protein
MGGQQQMPASESKSPSPSFILERQVFNFGAFDEGRKVGEVLCVALIETEKDARRLARAMASDLSLYNEDRIVEAIGADSVFEALADEITEAREHYKSRVSGTLYEMNFFDRAIVDVMIKSKGHLESSIW